MKSAIFLCMGLGLAILDAGDLYLTLPGLRAAQRWSEAVGQGDHGSMIIHDVYVKDGFGLPWWMVPAFLAVAVLTCFVFRWRFRAPRPVG